jgi:hypothetical protein
MSKTVAQRPRSARDIAECLTRFEGLRVMVPTGLCGWREVRGAVCLPFTHDPSAVGDAGDGAWRPVGLDERAAGDGSTRCIALVVDGPLGGAGPGLLHPAAVDAAEYRPPRQPRRIGRR